MAIGLNSSISELFAAAQLTAGWAAPQRTGRFIVTWKDGAAEAAERVLEHAGIPVVSVDDFAGQDLDFTRLPAIGALVLPRLNMAILYADQEHLASIFNAGTDGDPISSIEPEYFVYATGGSAYMRSTRRETTAAEQRASPLSARLSGMPATWGLTACNVPQSRFSGSGIKVAILDTGLDLTHPDFPSSRVTSKSFVDGEAVQDGPGHGTHCTGTACGPLTPPVQPRYGIAGGALIFAGKVLNNQGTGVDGTILAGKDWALANGCQIISMSLGRPVQPGAPPQQCYEQAGALALQNGCLVIAAAGNESQRPELVSPVDSPANASTIMAVASVGHGLGVSYFSNGGKIDIAGPGEDVYSTVPMPVRYNCASGTSMAVPHVAGCAALHAEAISTLRGPALWKRLQDSAQKLSASPGDVGAGLVQSP